MEINTCTSATCYAICRLSQLQPYHARLADTTYLRIPGIRSSIRELRQHLSEPHQLEGPTLPSPSPRCLRHHRSPSMHGLNRYRNLMAGQGGMEATCPSTQVTDVSGLCHDHCRPTDLSAVQRCLQEKQPAASALLGK